MHTKYEFDSIGGRSVPPLVITSDHVINDTHQGTVHVEAGTLELLGVLQGTLAIHTNASVVISGKQQGTVSLAQGTKVIVRGAIQGTVSVAQGALLIIEETGRLAGSLSNNGNVVLRGVFGGAKSGHGDMQIEGNGYIKPPIIRDGVSFYEWP
jgi:cytoskeletal protein CcmA (bactofilin family)